MNSSSPPKSPTQQSSLADSLPEGSEERHILKNELEPRVIHGGLKSSGKRKTARPFQAKAPMHIVLRSGRAKGVWSMRHRRNQAAVLRMIYVYAKRFQVKVYRASNTGDHLHLLLKASEKKHLSDYLRVLAGRVAVTITGAKRQTKRVGRFWDHLFWSRIVNWGRDFYQVRQYVRCAPEISNDFDEETDFYWKKVPLG
jgi:REP element-mobilizing transposase RayT